jgi:RNA polymerase sigma-70 factor (ECF subfamily)
MGQKVTVVPRTVHSTPVADADADGASAVVDVAVLYRAHERTVMRWAARLGGPGIDVEDVVQEVFLIAKRRLRSFDGPGSIKTWLFRTTEKIVQAARRKRRLRRWLSRSADPAASGMGAPRPTPAEALERERAVDEVYRVLDRLPERQRRVLVLFELEGLSTQEIADLVGAEVGTVRVWIFRARARFLEEHQRLFHSDPTSSTQGNQS